MSLPSIQRVRLLLALHLLLSSTQKEDRGGRGEGRGRLSKPRGSKGSRGGLVGGKKVGGSVGVGWVSGGKAEREVVEWFLGDKSSRLVVGSNVPSKGLDTLEQIHIT